MKYLKFLFLIIFVFIFSSTAHAENSFIFSTEPQSIPLSQVSGKINVLAQSPVTETTYLSFTSSSPTGQFLNSSGNPLTSAYISSGDSNRAVYYKDSTAGDFVISADVLSKDKTKITTISQHITVGQQSSGGGQDVTSTTNTTTETKTSENSSSPSSSTSAHSSPAELSNINQKMEFEISAGRDRLSSVGSSVAFSSTLTRRQNISDNNVIYSWSFGDGTTGQGANVSHIYKFPGEYSVVINASYSDIQAVSRIVVKVIEPKIDLGRVSGGVEITNNSVAEINLEGWNLSGGTKVFVFPKDTLIPHGKKIIFADEVTGINAGTIKIENPLGKKYAEIIDNSNSGISTNIVVLSANNTTEEIKNITEKIAYVSSQIKELEDPNIKFAVATLNSPADETNVSLPNTSALGTNSNTKIKDGLSVPEEQVANAITVFQAPDSRGFVSTVFAWPIKGFNFIRGLFSEK